MKKTFLGIALLLLISATHASAADRDPQNGQPRADRNILSSQLPAALLAEIKKDYKDYWITELIEEGKAKHPAFLLTLENADQILHLRSDDSERWVLMSTSVKAG
jgi:hypothetical protein